MSAKYRSYFHQNCYVQRETKNEIWFGSLPINYPLQPFFANSAKNLLKGCCGMMNRNHWRLSWLKQNCLFISNHYTVLFWILIKILRFLFYDNKKSIPLNSLSSQVHGFISISKKTYNSQIYITKNPPYSEFFLITLQWIWRKIVN